MQLIQVMCNWSKNKANGMLVGITSCVSEGDKHIIDFPLGYYNKLIGRKPASNKNLIDYSIK